MSSAAAPVLPARSVAVMVAVPVTAVAGTVVVALKAPVASGRTVPEINTVVVVPSPKVSVMGSLTAKPVPVIVLVMPGTPLLGVAPILVDVGRTSKAALATVPLMSVALN